MSRRQRRRCPSRTLFTYRSLEPGLVATRSNPKAQAIRLAPSAGIPMSNLALQAIVLPETLAGGTAVS